MVWKKKRKEKKRKIYEIIILSKEKKKGSERVAENYKEEATRINGELESFKTPSEGFVQRVRWLTSINTRNQLVNR